MYKQSPEVLFGAGPEGSCRSQPIRLEQVEHASKRRRGPPVEAMMGLPEDLLAGVGNVEEAVFVVTLPVHLCHRSGQGDQSFVVH